MSHSFTLCKDTIFTILTVLYNTIAFIHAGTVLITQGYAVFMPIPPSDVLQEVRDTMIDQYSLGMIVPTTGAALVLQPPL